MTDELTDEKPQRTGYDENGDSIKSDQGAESEEDEADTQKSEGEEEASDEDDEDSGDTESDDSKSDDIAKSKDTAIKVERERRKKAEKETAKAIARLESYEQDKEDSKKTYPDPKKPTPLAKRVWEAIARTDMMELAEEDPTVRERRGEIRDILFEELPELQDTKDKDGNYIGVKIANEISRGRSIQPSSGKDSVSVNKQTSSTQPKKQTPKKKPPTQAEIQKMTNAEFDAWEKAYYGF